MFRFAKKIIDWTLSLLRTVRFLIFGGIQSKLDEIHETTYQDAKKGFMPEEWWICDLSIATVKGTLRRHHGRPPGSFAMPQIGSYAWGVQEGPLLVIYSIVESSSRSLLGREQRERSLHVLAIHRRKGRTSPRF